MQTLMSSLRTLFNSERYDVPSYDVVHFSTGTSHHQVMTNSAASLVNLPPAETHPLFYVGIYAAIGLTGSILATISSLTQLTGALRASRILFKRLLATVMHATMRWHDTTPAGRILNRFSSDMATIDSSLTSSLQSINNSLAGFFSSIIVVVVIFPSFIFPATAIGYVYYRIAIGYLDTGRDLRRMEATTRSPVFSGFAELLEGIVTVRAFSAERRFQEEMFKKVDLTNQMHYNFWMLNRWLLFRFDCLGAVAVFTATLFALSGLVGSGWAGICITSAMAFTSNVYWTCRSWTQLEVDLK
jgi:ABC-type multidrug transport system fused ATPase/permease subunit